MKDYQNLIDDSDIARVILEYLVGHPHAADSADGVARWWLNGLATAATLPEVEFALKQLVARRALRKERLADGTTLYSSNARHASSL